jgi:hypothetical protein
MSLSPIVILGLSRSGTRIFSQIVGRIPGIGLITEHGFKESIPEDTALCSDAEVWADFFKFSPADHEYVDPDPAAAKRMRAWYDNFANGRRLAVKNPQNLARMEAVRGIFPDGTFVWVVREPHRLIESVLARNAKYKRSWGDVLLRRPVKQRAVLRTRELSHLPADDVIARAAHGLLRCAEEFTKAGKERFFRYDDLVSKPKESVAAIYEHLGSAAVASDETISLIQCREKPLKLFDDAYRASSNKPLIDRAISSYCATFGFGTEARGVPQRKSA